MSLVRASFRSTKWLTALAVASPWFLASPLPAQVCSWGGTSTTPAPVAVFLRSERDMQRSPGRLSADPGGGRVEIDPERSLVLVRDAFGGLIAARRSVERPVAVVAAAPGTYYLADLQSGSVTLYDAAGDAIGKLGQGSAEFQLPVDLAIDPDPTASSIYVADAGAHRIQVYSPEGDFLRSIGSFGSELGQFDFPVAVFVSAVGEVFVGDQNNDRVQVFSRDGTFLRCFGSRSTAFSRRFGRIQAITGDELGRIYVADAFQSNVRVFDSAGVLLSTIASLGEAPGELRTPAGMALDIHGRLFVASRNSGRVEVFGIDDFSDPQAPPGSLVFADGFESGNTSAWTGVSP